MKNKKCIDIVLDRIRQLEKQPETYRQAISELRFIAKETLAMDYNSLDQLLATKGE